MWLVLVGLAGACAGSPTPPPATTETSPSGPTSGGRAEPAPMAAPNTTRVRARPGVAVVPREARCRMRQVFFASNSAELDDEARRQLSAYARCLAGAPDDQDVLLTSHTDASGTEDYNQALSEQRAEAVAAFLQSRGVAEDRIEIRALGDQGVIEGVPGLWPLQRRVTLAPPGTPTGVTSSVPQRVPPGTAVPAAP